MLRRSGGGRCRRRLLGDSVVKSSGRKKGEMWKGMRESWRNEERLLRLRLLLKLLSKLL